jgi:hypothetical protein
MAEGALVEVIFAAGTVVSSAGVVEVLLVTAFGFAGSVSSFGFASLLEEFFSVLVVCVLECRFFL